MKVEKEWWCDKHLMYACQMEKNRLCEKFERCGEQIGDSGQAVLDMATVIETDDFSGNEIMKVVDVDDIKALPSVTPAPKKWKWINNHNETISCGCCHAWFHKDDRYSYMRYCPNCGEKLEVEE